MSKSYYDINKFYNRLNRHDFSNAFRNNSHFVCTNKQICKEFKTKTLKAGPDGISPKVLRMCSSQLCEILCTIFNLSLLCGVVPDIWKSSASFRFPRIIK